MMILSTLVFGASVKMLPLNLNTYSFSDPDPVPAVNEKRWPYFRYDGSEINGATQKWDAVELENDKIKVTILPSVGGKIWGATDKKTGRDFIYFNHAVKFRNIALRGPWTSGGIEFNFGIIGHAPSTSTPVDWCVRTNSDESVSYFCSNTELINRTTWQVEVRLGKNDSFFTTRSLWHNGSLLSTPYYHWMNAAYSTRGDPELIFPGSFYVRHDGDAHPWPIDEDGRDIRFVNKNDFGSNKSYHVCGGDTRLFGVWWKDWGFGAYHKNEYGEKYGRKAWIWALSREGEIWKDLLTDTDGQYMELQSGRMFSQPRRDTWKTPFKHPVFFPGVTDSFVEEWGVWHDRKEFADAWDKTNFVDRAQISPKDFDWSTAYGLFLRGEQAFREKDEITAEEFLRKALFKESCFAPALTLLGELYFRQAKYENAQKLIDKALSINAYDAGANYIDGLIAKRNGDTFKALERLGLAAYSPQWRAGAFREMSKIYLAKKEYSLALSAAEKCLESSAKSIDALALRVLALRGEGKKEIADRLLASALEVWPLSRILLSLKGNEPLSRNELANEVELETAFWFLSCGEIERSIKHFSASKCFIGDLMKAYLDKDEEALKTLSKMSVRFSFAFRSECVDAIDWAIGKNGNWKFKFLRAQFAAVNGEKEFAENILSVIDDADDEVFYLYRKKPGDLEKASSINDSWRVGLAKMHEAQAVKNWKRVKELGLEYLKRFPLCNPIQILYAKSLLELKEYKECLSFLGNINILPSEFGDNATDICHAAQDALGIKRTWPEKLGKGKPYSCNGSLYTNDTVSVKVTGVLFGSGANTDPNYVVPHLYAVFDSANGKEKKYWIYSVNHKGSFIANLHLTKEMRQELGSGAVFKGVRLEGGKKETNAKIKIEDVKVFREDLKPLDIKITPREKLPFPTRKETIVPLTPELSASDLKPQWNAKLPECCTVSMWRSGKSLIIDITAPAGSVKEIPLGVATEAKKLKSFPVPYLTWGERDGRVLVDLLEGGYFRLAQFDWYNSNASKVFARETPFGRELVAEYLPDTAGNYKSVHERIVITLSKSFDEILPEIPNPKSPWKHVCGKRVWRSHPSYNRAEDAALWRAAKKAGFKNLIITDHETMWRDGGEAFTFCTKAAEGKGGDEGQREYTRMMIDELGYLYGPYNNFTDISTQSEFYSRDGVARMEDGSFQMAWIRCYGPKPVLAPLACDIYAKEIKRKFDFNAAYCDVHTSMLPWYRTDYDFRAPGAATYAQTYYSWGEALLKQKHYLKGPVYSEGSHHFMWAGLVDGSYAQDRSYDFRKEPWIVDFELLRTQKLSTDIGMGTLGMFSPPKTELERMYYWPSAPKGRNELVNRFFAATIAFGHSGMLIADGCWSPANPFGPAFGRPTKPVWQEKGFPAEMYRSYFMIQALAAEYTQSEVESIRYAGADGRLRNSSEAIIDGSIALNHIVTRYRNGTVTVVNGNEEKVFKIKLDGRELVLSPNGFAGWGNGVEVLSTNIDGRRTHSAKGPEYSYYEIEGTPPKVNIFNEE